MTIPIRKGDVWLEDLEPSHGTEPGKVRPVVVVQTDLLNRVHPSTVVCPLTTKVEKGVRFLRVHLGAGEAGLTSASDVLVDQLRAIDNRRLVRRLGAISAQAQARLSRNLTILLG